MKKKDSDKIKQQLDDNTITGIPTKYNTENLYLPKTLKQSPDEQAISNYQYQNNIKQKLEQINNNSEDYIHIQSQDNEFDIIHEDEVHNLTKEGKLKNTPHVTINKENDDFDFISADDIHTAKKEVGSGYKHPIENFLPRTKQPLSDREKLENEYRYQIGNDRRLEIANTHDDDFDHITYDQVKPDLHPPKITTPKKQDLKIDELEQTQNKGRAK